MTAFLLSPEGQVIIPSLRVHPHHALEFRNGLSLRSKYVPNQALR
jgi:hypothetical protein